MTGLAEYSTATATPGPPSGGVAGWWGAGGSDPTAAVVYRLTEDVGASGEAAAAEHAEALGE